MKVLRILVVLCLALLVLPSQAEQSAYRSEPRTALVIGNADYQNGRLRNPINDAQSVADKLFQLGFKVLLRKNQNRESMYQSIMDFRNMLKEGGVGLFYYAGHGMQINGRNFLIPIDANIQHEEDIEFRGIDAGMVLSQMEAARSRVNLVVLDACRNNPYARANRSGLNGLAQMEAPKGTLIAFSTAPGSLAMDGGTNNSVYTKHLVQKLDMPAIPVEQVFKEVRIAVSHETGDKQIPWESSSLMGDFYFVPPTEAVHPTLALPPPPASTSIPVIIAERGQNSPATQPANQTATSAKPAPSQPAASSARDYNREGYEIEIKARHLTKDELPALEARAQNGDVIAQTTLGWAYLLGKGQLDGRGIPRSNPKLLKWTMAAAKKGYPVAQNNLGALYMDGIGVQLDYHKAQHYFKLAADQGYLTAHRNLIQVSTLLNARVDGNQVADMVKEVQKQLYRAVK